MVRVLSLLALFTVLGVTGCGGGGGGDGSSGARALPINLTAKSLQVMTPDPRIAYPLKVSATIAADNPATDVSVSLFAIDKTDDPAAEARQIPLGTQTISKVDVGTHSYELDVNVPSSVETPGQYYIAAVVDPVDEVGETDEDDNTTEVEATLSGEGSPNILIKDMELDRSALLINTDEYTKEVPGNVHNADAGGTITVGADGLGVSDTINIEAFAKLRLMRSDNGKSHDVPLYLWDYDEKTNVGHYTYAYGIDPSTGSTTPVEWLPLGQFKPQLAERTGDEVSLDDVDRNSAHMNFYFPGKLGYVLEQELRYPVMPCTGNCTLSIPPPTIPPPDLTAAAIDQLKSFLSGLPFSGIQGDESAGMAALSFAVCVDIRSADPSIVDRDAADNEKCSPLTITLPPVATTTPPPNLGGYTPQAPYTVPSGPLSSGDGYGTKGGGFAFMFGPYDFAATATADNRGYIESVQGGIPITIFGTVFDFMSATVRAQLVPDYNGKPADAETGFTLELRFLNTLLDSFHTGPASSPQVKLVYAKEAPDPPKETQLFVGPVPVIAGASVGGEIGVEYEFNFDEAPLKLGNTISPLASIEATLYAGVGTPLFSAGVEGVLTLLEEKLEFFVGTTIDVLHDGFSADPAEFAIIQSETLTNVFTGPQGALNLYAKYSVPVIATCKWGFVKVPCPKVKILKATYNIWRSPALFKLDDVLLDNPSLLFDVVVLHDGTPHYFVPPS